MQLQQQAPQSSMQDEWGWRWHLTPFNRELSSLQLNLIPQLLHQRRLLQDAHNMEGQVRQAGDSMGIRGATRGEHGTCSNWSWLVG